MHTMKRIKAALSLVALLLLATFTLDAQVEPPFNLRPGYEWTAPDWPAGQAPYWYDYGDGSTSNGPVPAELAMAQAASRERAPMRLAQSKATAPPTPPLPPTHQVGTTPEARELARDFHAGPRPGRFYMDSGLTLSTPDFDEVSYGYGVRLGYQVTRHWGFDFAVGHHGLDTSGSAVQDIGGRIVARMPFQLLSPYTFLGGRFDLERDQWTIEPGAGIELGADKLLRGFSIYAEANLRATTDGRNSYAFGAGAKLRF